MKVVQSGMDKDIFISYSRRDQEFVTRLASDLDAQVAGVWFDQSTIQLGQKWHDEIMEGIRECKAFILVLSPDAMESRYVREELNKALELGKTIFPVIYRSADWTDEIESLVREVQTLDLRSGSYTDNFHKLVDGLIEAGAGKSTGERPFLRQPTKPGLDIVLSKLPGWSFAWSMGWLVFWVVVLLFFGILIASQGNMGSDDLPAFAVILIGGGIGGLIGGLLAGFFTMLSLRPNAPSISWKHMSPTIRIWGISGPLGMIVSGVITALMLAVGAISAQSATPDCSGSLGDCVGQILGSAIGEFIGLVIITLLVFLLFVVAAWFLTGMFAGWQVIRHIRRLEPGITNRQGWQVSAGWGCGAIVAAVVMMLLVRILSSLLGL
ncbi:MAG TPA: toll/interleukin-1 receptor domain-containing protein [Anaerolineales bacterium]|nr:toll/interleukin-1 receptor domain-containing protein [Anaerolineales bacterium]